MTELLTSASERRGKAAVLAHYPDARLTRYTVRCYITRRDALLGEVNLGHGTTPSAAWRAAGAALPSVRISDSPDKTKADQNTQGKVVDSQFGVRASKKVAGAGRKAPRGQHGRAKRSSSRTKRANGPDKQVGLNPR